MSCLNSKLEIKRQCDPLRFCRSLYAFVYYLLYVHIFKVVDKNILDYFSFYFYRYTFWIDAYVHLSKILRSFCKNTSDWTSLSVENFLSHRSDFSFENRKQSLRVKSVLGSLGSPVHNCSIFIRNSVEQRYYNIVEESHTLSAIFPRRFFFMVSRVSQYMQTRINVYRSISLVKIDY